MAATQTRAKKPAANPSTMAVNAYRARMANQKAETLYCVIDAEAAKALDGIMHRKVCTKREAVEYALKRCAADLARKR